MISALIHKFSIGQLSKADLYHLQGLLGFSKDIEPEFVLKMKKKYSADVLDQIFQARKEA